MHNFIGGGSMTKREAKALEIVRANYPDEIMEDSEYMSLFADEVQMVLDGMDWMAQECYREAHSCYEDKMVNSHNATITRILNAGKEEV